MLNVEELEVVDLIPYLRDIAASDEAKERDKEFASSLVGGKWGYEARGYLTSKQAYAAKKMIDRIVNKPAPESTVELAGVHAFLKGAKRFLKFPKLSLQLANGMPCVIYMSGDKSKYPDTINIKVREDQYSDEWYGRIFDDGVWHRPRTAKPELIAQIKILLDEVSRDPAGVAATYGKITGNCCFCRHPLSDERSLDVGFGPVCADHYNLKEYWKKGDGATALAVNTLRSANPGAPRRRVRASR